jgi:hypothetical protein
MGTSITKPSFATLIAEEFLSSGSLSDVPKEVTDLIIKAHTLGY